MIDLADTLKSIDDFLNTNPEDIIQIKEGHLTREQLEAGREIVRKNSAILKFYEFEYNWCNECIYRILCCENYGVVDASDLSRCAPSDCDMFIPERIFEKVEGFEDIPREFPPGYFDED